ncbi:major facilitator superfamily domain-containing protein [Absidia repens]|uniref:Major facilitator superfamily domain-containing protein n=1 Tax=Absidia repens TaxID=90262 RepID=A0A1X2IA32_9FUNG|nr:major facilitator superfamily domain-containing protein [Absidia repens]
MVVVQDEKSLIQEKKIVRALDLRMMPLFCVFYFADFLDRANIGNATLAGIQNDLHLSSSQLSFAISAFYITYIMFEIPSNCILKRTRASIYLSSIMLAWGLVTIVLAFVTNFVGLFICRLLLGVAQSGYVPAILYQMSLVYKPTENTMRVAVLLTMASLSGIVSGPLAYASSFLEGQNGLHGWQYLFILEGVPTVVLSVLSFFLLFDDISRVKWLTNDQKEIQRSRMAQSSSDSNDGEHSNSSVTFQTFIQTFADWKVYMFSLVYFCQAVCMTSISIFLPTIIAGFGYPVLTSQLLTAPPCIASSAFVLLSGYITDRYDRRTPILIFGFFIMIMGYVLLLILHDSWALYGGLFVLTSGMGMVAAPTVGWSSVNFPDATIRVLAVATVVMIGNSGGVVASFLYPISNAPHHCKELFFFPKRIIHFT